MPKITLCFKDVKIREYPIAERQPLTIGRRHSNDIVIDNPAVSGNHARIEPVATTFILKDLDSTNGTFVNEEKIAIHILRHNDVILIGNHKLIFDCSDHLKASSKVRDDYDVGKTRVLNVKSYHDLNKKSADSLPSEVHHGHDSEGQKANNLSFFSRLLRKILG